MIKPVKCGCGGEAIIYINGARQAKIYCEKCGIESNVFATKYEAITAWNRAMGNRMELQTVERTAKVRDKKEDPMVDEWHHGRCMNCGKQVRRRDNYCSRCGSRLEWK